ncbi:MAG: phosphoribosylformylglycinamidine cyclo-ligase [Solirubrobacterales bacterium]
MTARPSAGAYAASGVDQRSADTAVSALVDVLRSIDPGRPSRQAIGSGHYASVLDLGSGKGLALCTDGVGTKLLVAEEMGRYDTIGIDCIAMNVNDLICVGAEPLAMLDYIAVPTADATTLVEVGRGLRTGAEKAGIEIPGGEVAQVGEIVSGLDLVGSAVGLVDLDSLITGADIAPGDAVIGLPSSGIHSNGYTLARSALDGLRLDDDRLGRPLGEILLEPTEIYVPAVLELLRSGLEIRGLAHITGGGLGNLLRLEADVGYEIAEPLAIPPVFELIRERAKVGDAEMWDVFNMGCGLCVVVPDGDAANATSLLQGHYPDARQTGTVTADSGTVRRGAAPG